MTDISNLDERLAALNTDFKAAPVATDDSKFDLPPDGDYQAVVNRWDFFESKKDELFLKTEYLVQHYPEHAGAQIDLIYSLEDPERFQYLKKDLATLGADVDSLDLTELRPGSPTLEGLCDTPVLLRVATSKKTNPNTGKPYRNAYLQERFGGPLTSDVTPPAGEGVGDPRTTSDDKIPF